MLMMMIGQFFDNYILSNTVPGILFDIIQLLSVMFDVQFLGLPFINSQSVGVYFSFELAMFHTSNENIRKSVGNIY